jgi:hypothetical protein
MIKEDIIVFLKEIELDLFNWLKKYGTQIRKNNNVDVYYEFPELCFLSSSILQSYLQKMVNCMLVLGTIFKSKTENLLYHVWIEIEEFDLSIDPTFMQFEEHDLYCIHLLPISDYKNPTLPNNRGTENREVIIKNFRHDLTFKKIADESESFNEYLKNLTKLYDENSRYFSSYQMKK